MSALAAPVPIPAAAVPAAPGARRTAVSDATIRPLRPPDEPLLEEVFEGMSATSRYRRFHAPKPRLTAADRRYLAGADGRDHVAFVALAPDGRALGVARSVRLDEDASAAEVAAEVIDAWQRRGLGTRLLAELARAAAAGGVRRFTATVLTESGLHRALRRRGWRVVSVDGPSVSLEVEVGTVAQAAPGGVAGNSRSTHSGSSTGRRYERPLIGT